MVGSGLGAMTLGCDRYSLSLQLGPGLTAQQTLEIGQVQPDTNSLPSTPDDSVCKRGKHPYYSIPDGPGQD